MTDPTIRASLETKVYVLSANQEIELPITAEFVRCLGNTGTFDIKISDREWAEFTDGRRYRAPPGTEVREFRIRDTSGASNTITLAFGTGDLADDSIALSGSVSVAPSSLLTSPAHDSIAATSTEQVAAIDTSRKAITVQNLPTNAREVYVGDSGAGTGEGIVLQPGERIRLVTTAAVHVHNPYSSAQSVALLVEDA